MPAWQVLGHLCLLRLVVGAIAVLFLEAPFFLGQGGEASTVLGVGSACTSSPQLEGQVKNE